MLAPEVGSLFESAEFPPTLLHPPFAPTTCDGASPAAVQEASPDFPPAVVGEILRLHDLGTDLDALAQEFGQTETELAQVLAVELKARADAKSREALP